MTTSQALQRPGGTIGYDVAGTGPLVVCVPGMGDLRTTWRHLAPAPVAAGYRVATMDLRGHGDSSTTFEEYDDEALASDIEALIEELGGPAVVIGNSMGAAAGVILAGTKPALVSKLVLIGAFVRNPKINALQKALFRAGTAPAVAALTWKSYLPKLYAGTKPADFDDYRASVIASLRRPGYAKGFSRTTKTTHDPAEAALRNVTAPSLVIMGADDPDWKDPAAEAEFIKSALGSDVLMLPDTGHYPQSQQPAQVIDAVTRFLA